VSRHGGELVVRALEDEGARLVFGIPGTHNIELYDALERSERVVPIVVTDEQSAGFMADGVSRTSDHVGVVNLVPGAGTTHALSGIAEALLDNVPLVVLACGIRGDSGRAYQLHDIDQRALLAPVTKAVLRPGSGAELYATVRRAFALARAGAPGPVAVEVPAELYLLAQDAPAPSWHEPAPPRKAPDPADLARVRDLLAGARAPALYLGNGARGGADRLVALAERLGAPVTTTVSGKGVFPESHRLWAWNGFGPQAPPFVRTIAERVDVLLAIGCRFAEVATGSYGLVPPRDLVHVDIDPAVFGKNFAPRIAVESDALAFVEALLPVLPPPRPADELAAEIARGHAAVLEAWRGERKGRLVSPAALFGGVQELAGRDTIHVADSGTGEFLALEHLRLEAPGRFLAPVDFSCMGYSVPAAIGAKLANPDRDVVAYTGDGAFLMTGLELLTAAHLGAGPVVFVLRDEEYGQIAQFQRASGALSASARLVPYSCEAVARAAGCEFLRLATDDAVPGAVARALELSRGGRPTVVEVKIDASSKTYFARGALVTNFGRLPLGDKVRKITRFAARAITGALARP
jgi:acetolactate synthase-1/2/3 large subunit